MGWIDRLVNKAGNIVDRLFPKWEVERDDDRPGAVIYVMRSTDGDYIVQDEGDGSWSWVLVDPETGAPLDLGAKLPSLEAAKTHAETHYRGEAAKNKG